MKLSNKQWVSLGGGILIVTVSIVIAILYFARKPDNSVQSNENLFSREVPRDYLSQFEAKDLELDEFERSQEEIEERNRFRDVRFEGKDFVIAAYSYHEDPGKGAPCSVSYYSNYLERDEHYYQITSENVFTILYEIMKPDSVEKFGDLINIYYTLFNPWCGVKPLLFSDTKYWELEHDQGNCKYDPIDVGGIFENEIFTYYIQDSGTPYSIEKISLTITDTSLEYSSEELYTCEGAGAIF